LVACTNPGVVYRLFYRTNLTAGTGWTLFKTVLGNGVNQSVSDTPADRRFYNVVAP
jgi:hypothetical protein